MASRPYSGVSILATTSSGLNPSLRNASNARSVHFRTSAAARGPSGIESSIRCSRAVTTGRAPLRGNCSVTMATDRTLASALTTGVNRGPRSMSQFSWSCPPRITSISGICSASWRSSSRSRCVSATMASLWPFNAATAARAASMTGAYLTHGCLFESIVSPSRPSRMVPDGVFTGTTAVGTVPGNGAPEASVTLLATILNFDSASRARNAASGMSNSWLPSVAQSSPSVLSTATICRPASRSPLTRAVPMRRRRHVIAAQRRDQVRHARLQARAEVRHPRQAAGLSRFDRADLVDVVEVEDGDRRPAAP